MSQATKPWRKQQEIPDAQIRDAAEGIHRVVMIVGGLTPIKHINGGCLALFEFGI